MPGPAWRRRVDGLRAELARGGELRRRLLRFAQAQTVQAGQSATCGCCALVRDEHRRLLSGQGRSAAPR